MSERRIWLSLNRPLSHFQTSASSFTIFPKDNAVCYGEKISFYATVNSGSALSSFSWNNGEGTDPEFKKNITKEGYVILVGKSAEGCYTSDTSGISLKNFDTAADHCLYFPNAFSPNEDGQNDGFGPRFIVPSPHFICRSSTAGAT